MCSDKNFYDIENRHKELINKAKAYMIAIKDKEHDINHVYDVVEFTKKLLSKVKLEIDCEVCIISAYWHDVGRIKSEENHEKESAEMLKDTMKLMNYDENLIFKCYKAIEFHKWSMSPTTTEGLIIKDADKLAWLGKKRWQNCINNKQRLDSIVELLPKLRNQILYFQESKELYDVEIINILKVLYDELQLIK